MILALGLFGMWFAKQTYVVWFIWCCKKWMGPTRELVSINACFEGHASKAVQFACMQFNGRQGFC
jgi:hypothetical protein